MGFLFNGGRADAGGGGGGDGGPTSAELVLTKMGGDYSVAANMTNVNGPRYDTLPTLFYVEVLASSDMSQPDADGAVLLRKALFAAVGNRFQYDLSGGTRNLELERIASGRISLKSGASSTGALTVRFYNVSIQLS